MMRVCSRSDAMRIGLRTIPVGKLGKSIRENDKKIEYHKCLVIVLVLTVRQAQCRMSSERKARFASLVSFRAKATKYSMLHSITHSDLARELRRLRWAYAGYR